VHRGGVVSTSVVQVLSYEGRAECDGCEHYVLRTVSEGAALDAAEVAPMMVAGPTQARAVVEVAVTVAATVAEAARAAGGE